MNKPNYLPPLSPRTGRSLEGKDFMQKPEVIADKELIHKWPIHKPIMEEQVYCPQILHRS